MELWAKTQQLHAQVEATRSRESALRSVGVVLDEAAALLRTAQATDGQTARAQVDKAVEVLTRARRDVG